MDAARVDGSRRSALGTLTHMPWEVLPFALSLFFMVEVLDRADTVAWLARVLSDAFGHNEASACFGIGMLSLLACQVLNNQPMTVLFTKVLIHPDFNVSSDVRTTAMDALIVGSNLGANLTLIGALAGPMWANLIRDKGMTMGNCQFVKVMLCVAPPVALAAFGTLWIESLII